MITRSLPVKLTDHELLAKGKEVAKIAKDISDAETQKSSTASALGKRIKELYEELDKASEIVNSGTEFREVECYEQKNFKNSTIEIFRADTHGHVSFRPMTETERQSELFPLREVSDDRPGDEELA